MTAAANGDPAIFGVLGYPATHSLSPALHRAAFSRLGMNAEYRIFEIPPEGLDAFLKDSRRSLQGFNITIPYKEQVIPFLDYVSGDARLIGAVNTVRVKAGRLEGFNTDGQGFMDDLAERGVDPRGARICVVGAGGASRAVCFFLAKASPEEIAVFNRDSRKATHLVEHLKEHFPKVTLRQAGSVDALGIERCRLLVNATSLGMKADDPLPVDARLLHKELFVYDLVYAPAETRLLRAAREKGAGFANGIGMLLHQGMLAFEIWTGVKPPREPMEQALRNALAG